jgi:hypothetical protein
MKTCRFKAARFDPHYGSFPGCARADEEKDGQFPITGTLNILNIGITSGTWMIFGYRLGFAKRALAFRLYITPISSSPRFHPRIEYG